MGKDVTVEEVLEIVKKDLPYYRRSKGGITLSGGECTLQPDFSAGLLRGAKELGISTAIESMAFADYSSIEKILPYLDLYLLDLKHMNGKKHKEYTGWGNERILENAKKIAKSGVELIIRTPVVPAFNDSAEDIRAIAKFAASLDGVKEYHLLPYHRLGQDKYAGLGRNYSLKEIEPPTKEKMQYLLSVAEESGLKCQIGG